LSKEEPVLSILAQTLTAGWMLKYSAAVDYSKIITTYPGDQGDETRYSTDGVAIFRNFSAEQRENGLTDFNDLARQNPEVVSRQLDEVLQGVRE
jgi:hypothetical protein